MIIGISGKISSGKDTVGKIILDLLDINYPAKSCITKGNWKVKKFADKLKDIVCLLINCTREQLEDANFKNKELGEEWWYYKRNNNLYNYLDYDTRVEDGSDFKSEVIKFTPRLLLQLLGTDCGRDIIHPNIWVNSLMNEYGAKEVSVKKSNDFILAGKEKIPVKYPNWIITDTRFPNELQAIKKRSGISIRVNRTPKHIIESLGGKTNITHNHILTYEHESETALDNADFDYFIDNNGTIEELIEKVKQILIKEKII